MKRSEERNEFVIAVIDETYGGDEETYEKESEAFRQRLVDEFGVDFEETNVGPGADIPAFLTVVRENAIPLLPWFLAVFFSGKPIVENFEAWRQAYGYLAKFFKRKIVLNRNGASLLAIQAVFDELGGAPKHLKLIGYQVSGIWDVDQFKALETPAEIGEGTDVINLGMTFHLFAIEADGAKFVVGVDGKRTLLKRV